MRYIIEMETDEINKHLKEKLKTCEELLDLAQVYCESAKPYDVITCLDDLDNLRKTLFQVDEICNAIMGCLIGMTETTLMKYKPSSLKTEELVNDTNSNDNK